MTDDLGERLAVAIDTAAAPVEAAEAKQRGERQARWRAAILVSITLVVLVAAGVAVAGTTRSASGRARVFVGGPSGEDRTWCVAVSRDEAIRRAVVRPLRFGAAIDRAKLVTGSEMLTLSEQMHLSGFGTGAGTAYSVEKRIKYWVIERHRPKNSHGPYAWGLVAVEANTGQIRENYGELYPPNDNADTARTPRYFDALPDHSSDCPNPRLTAP